MKIINVGVLGLYRGRSYYDAIMQNNGKVVAVCDKSEARLEETKERLGYDVTTYTDFEDLLNHKGLDAIYISNYFHEHAPFAIRALEKGIHVLSECTAAGTMAECVALVRAAEKSDAIYMLAENYPYMIFNQEMKRVYESGKLGKCLFAEGEYNHPLSPERREYIKSLRPHNTHWRNLTPRTYYITHSLGPLMYITGGMPKRVTAFASYSPEPSDPLFGYQVGDKAAIVMCQNDDGSVFRVTGCAAFGGHENSYRICGDRGQIENLRDGSGRVAIHYNDWQIPEGEQEHLTYEVEWHDKDKELILKSGHGGGDYIVIREFFTAIREGKSPFFDAYRSAAMSAVAILSHRSVLGGGIPYDIPDFRCEDDLKKYENDYLTPYYGANGEEPTVPCCSRLDHTPSPETVADYEALLKEEFKKDR